MNSRIFSREEVPSGTLLRSPYRLKVCPHYGHIRQEWHQWFLSTGRFRTAEKQHQVWATDYPYLGAAAWPGCDRRRLWDITSMAAVIIEADDDYDANRPGFGDANLRYRLLREHAADFRADHVETTEPKWGPLFAEVWRSFSAYVQPGVMKRLATVFVRYVEGCGAVDDYLAAHGEFTDIKQYMDIRYNSLGQLIDHMFVEISLGVDLSDVINEPALQAIVDSEVRRSIISQDVLSLYKDVGLGGDQTENIVTLITRIQGCSLSAALSAAVDMFTAEVATFDHLTERITHTPLGRLPKVTAFIQGLNDFAAGYMDWTAGSGRYTLQATCPWWETILARSHTLPGEGHDD